MSTSSSSSLIQVREWEAYEKFFFRFAFIYFVIQIVPLDWKFYYDIATIEWSSLYFQDLLRISTYMPKLFATSAFESWWLDSYADWIVWALIAVVAAFIWGKFDAATKQYNTLYYWLRVLLRYRLALGIISYGIVKLFPIQLPPPALSDLHTAYGDYLPWKIYSLTNGVAKAYYESTLGLLEIVGGLLLLHRKTTTIGLGLIIAYLLNVVIANFAYDIGQHVYSSYLLLLALALIVYDAPRLYHLLLLQGPALANRFRPVFSNPQLRYSRIVLRSTLGLFLVVLAFRSYSSYVNDNTPFPKVSGLKGAEGHYNVKEFKLNNKVLPYSLTDASRWQDVVFEQWNTLSVRSPRRIIADLKNPSFKPHSKANDYEEVGNAGRAFYTYTVDDNQRVLFLQNKSRLYKQEQFQFHYDRPNDSTLVLQGLNEKKDSLSIVLEKTHKKYLLKEGRRKPLKIY